MVELGAPDVDLRWLGVRRHQLSLALGGLALVGDGVLRRGAPWVEWVAGLVLVVAAAPTASGPTLGGWVATITRFAMRGAWLEPGPARAAPWSSYRLIHRGRLDLSGADRDLARGLAEHVDALALAGGGQELSLRVGAVGSRVETVLVQPASVAPPPGWSSDAEALARLTGLGARPGAVLERWGYLRTREGVLALVRVEDLTAVPRGRAALEGLQLSGPGVVLSVRLAVVGGARARRLAERAVHRVRSDGAASALAGFRRTARLERSLERLRQRESLVAQGRALARVAILVSVRARDLDELDERVAMVLRVARESGLRCARGRGRQGPWLADHLPEGSW